MPPQTLSFPYSEGIVDPLSSLKCGGIIMIQSSPTVLSRLLMLLTDPSGYWDTGAISTPRSDAVGRTAVPGRLPTYPSSSGV